MAEQAKASNVRDRVYAVCFAGRFKRAQHFDRSAIEPRHRRNSRVQSRLLQPILLQSGGKDAGANRLGEKKNIVCLRADISPYPFRIDKARDRVAELDVLIA